MTREIKPIPGFPYPVNPDAKLFWCHMSVDEDHNCDECGCYRESYNDWLKQIQDMSGVSEDLLGPATT